MALPSLSALLLLCLALLPIATRSQGTTATLDGVGNLHINTTAGKRVFVNAMDVTQALETISALEGQVALLQRGLPFGKLMLLGGLTASSASALMSGFDGATWSSPEVMPMALQGHSGVVHDGYLYILGGFSGSSATLVSNVWRYNGITWTPEANLPRIKYFAGAVSFNGFLYSIGGSNNTGVYDAVERLENGAWRNQQPLNQRRYGLAAAVYRSRIYVCGGVATRTCERFDGTSWEYAPSMVIDRYSAGMVVFRGALLVIGGFSKGNDDNSFGGPVGTIERFDGITWTPNAYPPLKSARYFSGAAIFRGSIHVVCGYADGIGLLNTIERFNGTDWVVSSGPRSATQAALVTF